MTENKSLEMEKFKYWKQLNTMFYAQVYEVQLLDILTCSNCCFLLFEQFFIICFIQLLFYDTLIMENGI